MATSIGAGLFKSLPKPKYTGEDEEPAVQHDRQQKGPRIVGPGVMDESQVVVRTAGPPPYGQRSTWRPRNPEDFGDGGAFPEIHVAQYPLDMGKKGTSNKTNALAMQVDAEGKVKYDEIARQGHSKGRIVHASFKDLIPLRQQADMGEISLERPSSEDVGKSMEKTKAALSKLVDGAAAAQKPKSLVKQRAEPTYVRYTPANQMGDNEKRNDRIIKIVEKEVDPMEPPKFRYKKIPRGPPSPPPPIMHSPPRKLTAEDQEAWRIPPAVSNWKNPRGYTIPLDKRLAADGRGMQDITINDKFAQFSEALFTADQHAREEVKERAAMQAKLAEKEREEKEEKLRALAQKVRESRATAARHHDAPSRSRSRSPRRRRLSSSSRSSSADSSDEEAIRMREERRREQRREDERKLRQSRMGTKRRVEHMTREQNLFNG